MKNNKLCRFFMAEEHRNIQIIITSFIWPFKIEKHTYKTYKTHTHTYTVYIYINVYKAHIYKI